MAAANAMSSSCQSIAAVTLGNMATTGGVGTGGCLRSGNGNGNTQYVMGTGSLGRLKLKTLGASDEELDFAQVSSDKMISITMQSLLYPWVSTQSHLTPPF